MNRIIIFVCLIVSVLSCDTIDDGVKGKYLCAVDAGSDADKLIRFIYDVNYYLTSDLTELQRNSLLASNIIRLYPETYFYYSTYINTKLVMYLDELLVKGDEREFMKYAVDIIAPNNGFNSSGAQQLFDDYINGNIPSQYDFSNSRNVLQAIIDYVNIDDKISSVLFWLYDNAHLSYQDPNQYFKKFIGGLLDNFVLPDEAEELGKYILKYVTIANNSDEVRPMIRDFLGSKYIPDSIDEMIDELTMNEANWKQFTQNHWIAMNVAYALVWKYAEPEISQTVEGTQFEDEFEFVQSFLSDYILANFTAILYTNVGEFDYYYNQISGFINSTDIRDGYKDLYTILLKLVKNSLDGSAVTPIYDELESFFDTTDIINDKLKDALNELFEYQLDNSNNTEIIIWIEIMEYVDSLDLASSTRAWFEENIQQPNITSWRQFYLLFFTEIYETISCGPGCNYTYIVSREYNWNNIENFLLLSIDIIDKDSVTFGDFTGPFWPNNLIDNLNRVASVIEEAGIYPNATEDGYYQLTNAIFLSITDMYSLQYPINALLNVTAQVSPKILVPTSRDYYFGERTFVPGYVDFVAHVYVPGYYIQGTGHPEEFVKEVLLIMENTLDNTMNMRDLIDTAQLYLDLNTFDVTTFDGLIEFICDETKDITKELCIVFEMVNATVTLINEFSSGFSNFTYKNSITDIANTIHLPEYLPFLEHLVDALVSTFYPNEGATIISSIEATRQYWTSSNITSNNIINLIESIGNLYLLDDIALQNKWKYTILYVEEIFNNTDIILNSNIDELINILKGITRAPTSPTYMPSISPSKTPTSYPSKMPTLTPSITPTLLPSMTPSKIPTLTPSISPTLLPSMTPTKKPTLTPTLVPTLLTKMPSWSPTIPGETRSPSFAPTKSSDTPSINTNAPTMEPTTRFDVTTSSNGSSYQFYSKWLCFIFVLTYFVF